MTRLRITSRGLDAAIADIDGWEDRARNLSPLSETIRDRWHEAEGRIIGQRQGWAAHKPSTRRRYRWPVRGHRGGRLGHLSGEMHAALTKPGHPGIRKWDSGNLRVELGPKRRGPVAHAAIFHTGTTAQKARRVVDIDNKALEAIADDVTVFVIGEHAGRRA